MITEHRAERQSEYILLENNLFTPHLNLFMSCILSLFCHCLVTLLSLPLSCMLSLYCHCLVSCHPFVALLSLSCHCFVSVLTLKLAPSCPCLLSLFCLLTYLVYVFSLSFLLSLYVTMCRVCHAVESILW